ncbi:MAG: SCO family protein [Burkholderiales bacterium]
MTHRWTLAALLAISVWTGAVQAGTTAAALPADSVYRTALGLRDQAGHPFTLVSLRGRPVIVSMIYASCQDACPMTVETIKRIRAEVKARSGRAAPPVVLVSFDPAHDSVRALAMMAAMHHVEAPAWRIARPEQGDVRAVAATLGVSYRMRPNGEFSHNAEIVLLDADGRIAAKTSDIGAPDPGFVDQVSRAGAD